VIVGGGLLLGGGLAGTQLAGHSPSSGAVYTVAEVRERLDREPSTWLQRTVRVRAVAQMQTVLMSTSGASTSVRVPALMDPGARPTAPWLLLAPGARSRDREFLRGLPLLRGLVAPPQTPAWGTPTVYDVTLQRTTCLVPQAQPCYEADLVDAAPGAFPNIQ
jgi:hypothetical protein